ncbi:Hsp20/alpha crystallin family protein [Georgenia sp. AZ-5]|uniref:Hsp20/alpha crystallin family protein n=1 Tax=Georgenia sp. AZ-5 TaxID=3367526 RepID=UPI0037551AF2
MTAESKEPQAEQGRQLGRRSPRELAEHLWGGGPGRWDLWPFGETGWPFREIGRPAGMPIRVEEVREGDQLVVRAELPGVDPEKDVEVTVDEGVLTISAEKRERAEEKGAEGYRSEFRYGHFERHVRLPRGTSPDVISASYRDGVLEVRLPAGEPPATRRIEIQRG